METVLCSRERLCALLAELAPRWWDPSSAVDTVDVVDAWEVRSGGRTVGAAWFDSDDLLHLAFGATGHGSLGKAALVRRLLASRPDAWLAVPESQSAVARWLHRKASLVLVGPLREAGYVLMLP